jgi:hypothetical protein
MSDPRKLHVGTTGSQAIVGKGLGAYAGNAAERAAVSRGLDRMMTPEQVAEARKKQIEGRQPAVAAEEPKGEGALQQKEEAAPAESSKTRDEMINVNLKVNDNQVQVARSSMRQQANNEVREARWTSYADIGAA